ncbi:ABC transporter permease [Anaerocolumna sp. AGMB13025]|uniref:ABC transporter permease n=1 Tax=Anaerocolumna sp. AGMB13025 TaxID=3039116 RepID=UPI002420428C|nr:ABC transporter permease [Anaerocolumna sp. AGMB13025]WFR55128.1 ABC transporter permease [Anaerocolumna sp. AGMB13025]
MENVKSFFRVLYNNKQAFAGMIILTLFLVMAIFGPLIVPLDLGTDFLHRYQWPSFRHPFGTDYVGNDLFQQIVHGSRSVLFIGLLASLFTVALGFALGALAGFAGGIADKIISMLIQILISIPIFPVQLIIAVVFPVQNVIMLAIVLAVLSWAWLARNVRAAILSLKQREFVLVCRIMGLPKIHIIFKEILPNVTSYLASTFVLNTNSAIAASVGLMLLGMAPYDATHWSIMLSNASTQANSGMNTAGIFNMMVPTAAFILLQMSLIFFANGLDEALNPRLRTTNKVRKVKKEGQV